LKEANDKLAYQIEHVEEQVLVKTRDIRSIMEHIPLGVFSITAQHTVHKDYSKSVESLFHRSNIADEPALSVLFDHALLSADKKNQIHAALSHAIGDDLLNFELNREVLVDQMVTEWQGEKRIYSLSWNPVCLDDQRVEKILVTVHDSTRLLALESEAEAQRRDMTMIKKILDVSPARFQSFLRQAERLLQECHDIVISREKAIAEWHILRMNLHTLKGTARALDLDDLSDLCHKLEDVSTPDHADLKDQLGELENRIAQYKNLAIEKLGRRLGGNEAIELSIQDVHGLIQDLTHGTAQHLKALEKAAYRPLEELLAQSLKCVNRLSLELGKPSPHIQVEAAGLGVTQDGYDALSGVLSHLIRNSLDHGLESADERARKGKQPKGSIQVRAFTEHGDCFIDFSDDGAGLDMQALRKKGQSCELLGPQPSAQEIGELIFVAEFSTRDAVSTVSGRGLGLSAVREALRREGGDIALILTEGLLDYTPFLLRLRLPQQDWICFHEQIVSLSA
jgi:HPt (histidine-containing phosphotransfer) domain-containing protein